MIISKIDFNNNCPGRRVGEGATPRASCPTIPDFVREPDVKALRIHEFADPESVIVEEIPAPALRAGEVVVRVEAASVNPLDIKLITGARRQAFPLSFPYTLGIDFAGVIEQTGPLVSRWKAGDRVLGRSDPKRGGAFAEYIAAPVANIAAAPSTDNCYAAAAALPTAAGTAWQALVEIAALDTGQAVLIHAGAGGVGTFAIQIAHRLGAHVTVTASGDGLELARSLGAGEVIDYRAEDFTKGGARFDAVLDTLGGETQARSFEVLRPGGFLLSLLAPPDDGRAQAHHIRACRVSNETDAGRLNQLAGLLEDGDLRAVTDSIHGFPEARQALARVASGRSRGKVILQGWD